MGASGSKGENTKDLPATIDPIYQVAEHDAKVKGDEPLRFRIPEHTQKLTKRTLTSSIDLALDWSKLGVEEYRDGGGQSANGLVGSGTYSSMAKQSLAHTKS